MVVKDLLTAKRLPADVALELFHSSVRLKVIEQAGVGGELARRLAHPAHEIYRRGA